MKNSSLHLLILFMLNCMNAYSQKININAGISNACMLSYSDNIYFSTGIDSSQFENESIAYFTSIGYAVDSNWEIRLSTHFDFIELESEYDSRNTNQTIQAEYTLATGRTVQSNFEISPGISRFYSIKRLKIYAGLEVPITFYNSINCRAVKNIFYTNSSDQSNFEEIRSASIPGGYSIGIGGFAGASFKIINHLLAGFELSSSLRYQNSGGGFNTNVSYPIITANPNVEEFNIYSYHVTKGFTPIISRFNLFLAILL